MASMPQPYVNSINLFTATAHTSPGPGMTTSPKRVWTDPNNLWVELNDGRTLSVPLAWFPRLLAATSEQRAHYELSPRGIHWDELDEDISVDGLLAGQGDKRWHRLEAA